MDGSVSGKTLSRKKTISKKIAITQNNIELATIIKLLLLNFFITPLLFFLMSFLCRETISILLSATIINNDAANLSLYDFLFKSFQYTNDFKLFDNYVLFFRWFFVVYMVWVMIYNICIFKTLNNKSSN